MIFLWMRFCSLRYEPNHSFSGPVNLCVLSSEIWSPRESRYSLLSRDIVSVTDSSKVFFQREKVVLSIFYFIYGVFVIFRYMENGFYIEFWEGSAFVVDMMHESLMLSEWFNQI